MGTEGPGALPVRLSVDARLHDELVAFLEGTLGWQVTRDDELPAALALTAVGAAPVRGVPCVLLVRDDDPPDRAARDGAGVAAVLRWPDDRERLDALAGDLLLRAGPTGHGPVTLRLGGAAGGVGTTTVTLALGGLLGWHGQPTLVVASGDVPLPGVAVVDPGALSAHRTWDAATAVAGVPNLRVLATTPGPRAPAVVPDGVVVLRDDGVSADVDVLVCARDRAGAAALDTTVAAAAVVVGRGAIPPQAWGRATARRVRQIHVDWSARVGRAGVHRRVPASLPGRWLAGLAPLAASLSPRDMQMAARSRPRRPAEARAALVHR